MDKINVTVWNAYMHEKLEPAIGKIYPEGIHGAIAKMLGRDEKYNIRTATLEMPEQQLRGEFDTEKRTELAIEMTQTLLDDHMFFFASHLKMSMVSGEGVTGLTAHPCDYYEITVNLDKNK